GRPLTMPTAVWSPTVIVHGLWIFVDAANLQPGRRTPDATRAATGSDPQPVTGSMVPPEAMVPGWRRPAWALYGS
ncbi:MAG: hypothetical protein ACQSGP_08545, partial [Frankia sp.]